MPVRGKVLMGRIGDDAGRPGVDTQASSVESQLTLATLYPTINDAVVIIDDRGKIRSVSPSTERMFGYRSSDLVGENVSVLMPSPHRQKHDHYIQHYLDTGVRKIIGIGRIVQARRRDGSTFPCELSVGETREGPERLFLGVMHDLTIRQGAYRRLHAVQAELAHVARISQMGTLASALAHEINQPLAAIGNYVDGAITALEAGGDGGNGLAIEALEHCSAEVTRAGEIIRRLREFIRHGQSVREISSATTLVNEAIALALADGDGAGIAISEHLDPKVDLLFCDRIQLQQVMVNLLRNALEAMEGSVDKRIAVTTRPHEQGMVEFIIADSGPGIAPGIAQRFFEPFETTKQNGLGLGLSISHTIVTAHNGRIWVEPSSLGGTAFHFTVPSATTAADEQE